MVSEEYKQNIREAISEAMNKAVGREIKPARTTYNSDTVVDRTIENCAFVEDMMSTDLRYVLHLLKNSGKGIVWRPPFMRDLRRLLDQKTPHFILTSRAPTLYAWQDSDQPGLVKADEQTIRMLWGYDNKHDALFESFGKKTYPQLIHHINRTVEQIFKGPGFWES